MTSVPQMSFSNLCEGDNKVTQMFSIYSYHLFLFSSFFLLFLFLWTLLPVPILGKIVGWLWSLPPLSLGAVGGALVHQRKRTIRFLIVVDVSTEPSIPVSAWHRFSQAVRTSFLLSWATLVRVDQRHSSRKDFLVCKEGLQREGRGRVERLPLWSILDISLTACRKWIVRKYFPSNMNSKRTMAPSQARLDSHELGWPLWGIYCREARVPR